MKLREMNEETLVDVSIEGAVLLGPDVVCDGFFYGPKARIQSHIHADHMGDFETSKGLQKIILSPETYELLILEKNAELPYRANIIPVEHNQQIKIGSSNIQLMSSGHMLGAVQAQVTLSNGNRVGYSGDFNWPLDEAIQVDTLILDSSCGSTIRNCHYDKEDVKDRMLELFCAELRKGPIMLKAYRGTLQYALDILSNEIRAPLLCSDLIYKEIEIYNKFGFIFPNYFLINSSEGKKIVRNESYIYICNFRKYNPNISLAKTTKITLSLFRTDEKDPVRKFSESSYRIALSAHADFNDTLEYVLATGAKEVITDNSRGGHAIDLAQEIRAHLKIEAHPSTNTISNNWKR